MAQSSRAELMWINAASQLSVVLSVKEQTAVPGDNRFQEPGWFEEFVWAGTATQWIGSHLCQGKAACIST